MNVSVIIPVYNAEKYIQKAIESCLELDEVKEIIIIDDGYNDQSKAIVKDLAIKYSRIKLFEHPNNENKGAGSSRNLGIKKATQEYIAFLDADDFYLPNRFRKDKEIFDSFPEVDGCYSAIGCFFYSREAEETYSRHFKTEITTVNPDVNPTPENLFRGRIGLIPNFGHFSLDGLTVKKSSIDINKMAFPESSMHEDTAFIIRLSYYCKIHPADLSKPVALRGVHAENRITANYQLKMRDQYANMSSMWGFIYEWAKEIPEMGRKEFLKIQQRSISYSLLSDSRHKKKTLVKKLLLHPRLLFDSLYPEIHKLYFSNTRATWFLSIRNLVIKLRSFLISKFK